MSAQCFAVANRIHRFNNATMRCVYCGEQYNPNEHQLEREAPADPELAEFKALVARVCESLDRYAAAVSKQGEAIAALAISAGEMAKASGSLVNTFFVASSVEETVPNHPAEPSAPGVPRVLDDTPMP